jgi:CubicO group peptidase (beta-lactamase class C family)
MGKFLSHVLAYAAGPLSGASREAMLRDQTTPMPLIPAEQKWAQRWGLGWMLGSASFGNLVSRRTFGHTGATGTLFWADPESGLACVLLTNQPDRSQFLFQRYSNALASAIED